jgi:Amt family ammonium transporter
MLNRSTETAYQLLNKAARACEIARSINQSGVHIYNPEVDAVGDGKAMTQLRNWQQEIYQALTEGRFKVVFQMISRIDAGDGEDYEMLFRMGEKETGTDILPGEFIVAAEQSGLIVVIDQWVTSQAINMIADDIAQGRRGKYFIKLSNRTLASDDFINWLLDELKKTSIQNNRLVFEINTTELVKRPIEVHALVRALHRLNCRVVLEYFGTQKNHMSIIEHFFFDYIKLDRSLTHGITADGARLGMVKSIVAQAKTAGIGTIAEFIEDAKTLGVLCNVGVDFIQGHFVQHPGGAMDVSNG